MVHQCSFLLIVVLQQDDACPPTIRVAMDFQAQNYFKMLLWPPMSSDINAMEHYGFRRREN